MQDEEDLAKFIEEQRAKIAYDRGRLKNNPPSSITDNPANRQILNLDKENRVPYDDTVGALPPRSERRDPLPIQTTTRPPSTPRIFRLGDDYRKKQEKLKEELRTDYRNAMAEKNLTGKRHLGNAEAPLGMRTNSDLGLSLPLKDRLSAKERMRLERNKEYNDFLHIKEDLDRQQREARSLSRSPVRFAPAATPVTKIFAPRSGGINVIPSGGKVTSGIVHSSIKEPSTETYQELLERKRKQEKSYRGVNDDDDDARERTRRRDADREDDDGYYSQRRVRFPSKGRKSHGRGRSRRDDDFLDEEFDDHRSHRGRRRGRPGRRGRRYSSEDDSEDESEEDRTPRRRKNVSSERRKPAPSFERDATTGSLRASKQKSESDDLRSKSAPPDQEFTGLPIGHVPSANTVQRRKEEYRTQLLQQMEENKNQKKKARELDKQSDAISFNEQINRNNNNVKGQNVSPAKRRATPSPPPKDSDPRQRKKGKRSTRKVQLDLSSEEEEDVSPRRGAYRGPHPSQPYFAPPHQPPMGYYPPQYANPYNDPYYYYGTRNPLDPGATTLPPPQAGGYPGVSPVMAAAYATGRADRNESPDRERNVPAGRRSYKNESSSLIADENREHEKKKQQTILYQEELKDQIAQKEKEKRTAKAEKERYDMKIEKEARNYNPWGKGGGGAPMKDRQGNLISDLRQMHLENEEAGNDPAKAQEVVRERLPQTNLYHREERAVIDLSPGNAPDDDDNMLSPRFGRSNPFEMKQSDQQKAQRDGYKDYLQKQIEEKRRLEVEKRERDRIEEEKEERRLEEQRKKIQAELEAELEKDRKKKEMAERQNDEIRIQAEERRKEEHRRKLEDEEEQRKRKEKELDEKLRSMTKSPLIPTLRNLQRQESPSLPPSPAHEPPLRTQEDPRIATQPPQRQPVTRTPRIQTYRTDSPHQYERRPPIQSRNETKRVSRELSALRKQLLSEQRRVEDQLRTVDLSKPPPRKINTEYLVDLSRAKQKPVAVRRPPTVENERPSSRALREFTDYKYRPDDTASIRMFRAEYPETPDGAKALEKQQQALLARQGRNLNDLRHQAISEPALTNRRERERPRRGLIPLSVAQSKASLLEAETTYIPIVPDDDDDAENAYHFESNASSVPQSGQSSRMPSARERRRLVKKPPSARSEIIVPPRARPDNYSLNSLSSLATLDVDRLANKNVERLDKLRVIQGDDVSLTDPDDILDRFVNKQTKGRRPPTNDDGMGGRAGISGYRNPDQVLASFSNRPPSVNTVDTEPWLRPETGPTVA